GQHLANQVHARQVAFQAWPLFRIGYGRRGEREEGTGRQRVIAGGQPVNELLFARLVFVPVHGGPPRSCWRRSIARSHSLRAALAERPSSRLISSNVRSSW